VTLPGAYTPASIAIKVIRLHKPPHHAKIVAQGGGFEPFANINTTGTKLKYGITNLKM
jgi:hypothetical protein